MSLVIDQILYSDSLSLLAYLSGLRQCFNW